MRAPQHIKRKSSASVSSSKCGFRLGVLLGWIAVFLPCLAIAETAGEVDGGALLRALRREQSSQHLILQGKIRKGNLTLPYKMVMDGPAIRFEFSNAKPKEPAVVTIRIGSLDATLEVRDLDGKLLPAKFSDEIMGMGVSYEDLGLRFLFWPGGAVEGEERLMLAKCVRVRVKKPDVEASSYREVLLWLSQSNGAFLKCEAYGEKGALLKRFTVRSLQTLNQTTMLKQLRVETAKESDEPIYVDVDGDGAVFRPGK